MVCPICLGVPLIIAICEMLGVHPFIATTLIGSMVFALAGYTDLWLRNIREKRTGEKDKPYVPFQMVLLFIFYMALVILTYYLTGMLNYGVGETGGVCK